MSAEFSINIEKFLDDDNVEKFIKMLEIFDLEPNLLYTGDDDIFYECKELYIYNKVRLVDYCAAYGKINILKYIVSRGILLSIRAALVACYNGQLEIIKYMVHEISCYEDIEKLFYYSCKGIQLDVLKYLTTKYVLNHTSVENCIQIASDSFEIIKFLIDTYNKPIGEYTCYTYSLIKDAYNRQGLLVVTTECGICQENIEVTDNYTQCIECKCLIHLECRKKWSFSCVFCKT